MTGVYRYTLKRSSVDSRDYKLSLTKPKRL